MYFALGAALALAAFFLLNACFSLGTRILLSLAKKISSPLRPRAALFFLLSVFPASAAVLCTLLLVIPSYLTLEPRGTAERMGWLLPLLASLSAWLIGSRWFEAVVSWHKSHHILRQWLRRSEAVCLPGVKIPAYRLQEAFPVVAVIGALRPRLFVSEQVLEALTAEEFAAAIQHEVGHLAARDNLKRCLAQMCPPALPFLAGSGKLGRLWHVATEQSADRYAVRQGKAAPLNLASALIKVSRLAAIGQPSAIPSGAYLLEQQDVPDIARRVHALLEAADCTAAPANPSTTPQRRILFFGFLVSALFLLAASYSSVLVGVHEGLERFLHLVS